MNITEFAISRNKAPQAVHKYVKRHAEIFDAITIKNGKDVLLTDEALKILDEVYPLPKPVQVIVDHESRDKLLKAQKEIIRLQSEMNTQSKLLARAEYHEFLLEQKDSELKRLTEKEKYQDEIIQQQDEELNQQRDTIMLQTDQLQQSEREKEELKEQVEKMKADLQAERERNQQIQNTGLFGRIFKKWDNK